MLLISRLPPALRINQLQLPRPLLRIHDSSSDESDCPSLEVLKSQLLQKKVDKRLRELNQSSHCQGKEKFKSMRGGSIKVQVKHKLHWPHEAILDEVTHQCVNYDQLSLTQWVPGLCRNILEETDGSRKDIMVSNLADLMEDATDFSWQGGEGGTCRINVRNGNVNSSMEDGDQIDHNRRAHAQKHVSHRPNFGKQDNNKKPWFCKNYQSNTCIFTKDHETNGKLHRHICAYYLNLGKQLTH